MSADYIFHFDTDGGNVIEDELLTYNSPIVRPANPVKDGYTFIGWYSDVTKTVPYFCTDEGISSDVTIYAGWVENGSNMIRFTANPLYKNVSFTPSAFTVHPGEPVTITSSGSTGTGYVWYINGAAVEPPVSTGRYTFTPADPGDYLISVTFTDQNIGYAGSVKITSTYTPVTGYSITYYLNGGTGTAPSLMRTPVDGTFTPPVAGDVTRHGCTFTGWATKSDGSGTLYTAGTPATVTLDTILYAKWSPNSHTLTFNGNGIPGAITQQTVLYGKTIQLPHQSFTREGWTFSGWATSDYGSVIYAEEGYYTGVDTDVTLYARWAISMTEQQKMVLVPGGTFMQDGIAWVNPNYVDQTEFQHTISDFYMAKYEVSFELWYAVKSWGAGNGYTFTNNGREGFEGPKGLPPVSLKHQPVAEISWQDAIVWCNAYSEKEGLVPVYKEDTDIIKSISSGYIDEPTVDWGANGYRLPTEGEWQYAASYIDGTQWTNYTYMSGASQPYTDEVESAQYAWWDGISGHRTLPIGTKLPNQLGLYDMSGGLWEYCWDWYGVYPTGNQVDYRGAASSTTRSMRGGSSLSGTGSLQIGLRNKSTPANNGNNHGFRVVRTAIPRSGLVGEWLMDGGVNGGTVTGATLTTDRKGKVDSAYTFNNGETYIKLATLPLAGGTATPTSFTVSAWIRSTGPATQDQIIFIQSVSGGNNNLSLQMKNDGTLIYGLFPPANMQVNGGTITKVVQNTWTHVAVTRNGDVVKLYIGGAVVKEETTTGMTYSGLSITDAFIGSSGTGVTDWEFIGDIDDLRVYTRPLTDSEILALSKE